MATTTKYISLDFYNNSVVNVYAKQSDANSRFINVTCTDYGKKVTLDKSNVSALVRVRKSDGKIVFNDTEILDDGTVLVTITSQMVASSGKQDVDLMILSSPNVSADDYMSMEEIENLSGVSVISVMPFRIMVTSSPIDSSEITSTNEYDALVKTMAKLQSLETSVRNAEDARISAEVTRELNNTKTLQATEEAKSATTAANNAATSANNAASKANTATTNANTATTNANNAATSANNAAKSANNAVAEYETIKDQSGIILKSEKGAANGVATLNSSSKIPSSQLDISSFAKNNLTTTSAGYVLDARQGKELNTKITDLQTAVDGLHKVYFKSSVDNSIGKDGDILMVPIS